VAYCSNCGTQLHEDDRFCPSCGRPQDRKEGTPPAQDPRWAEAERRLISRAKPTVVLLWISAAMSGILFVSTIFEADLLRRLHDGVATIAQADASDRRQALLGLLGLLLLLFTAIWWLLWQQRAHANLELLGARDLRFTPGWAVGWWFIPFANFFQPYRAMRELWLASAEPASPRQGRSAMRIGVWWTFFFSARLLAAIAGAMRAGEDATYEDVLLATNLVIVSLLIEVVAAIVAVTIVQDIVRLQTQSAKEGQPGESTTATVDLPPDDQFYWKQ